MSFSGWLESLRNRRWSRNARAGLARSIEAVESRQLPSVVSLFVGGELNVASTADEDIVIRPNPTRSSDVQVLINGVSDPTLTGVPLTDVTSIVIEGGDERNNIDLSAVMATAFPNIAAIRVDGHNGHDTIIGSPDYGDSIHGGDGNDLITDDGGLNTLFGGDGNDTITGGSGNDQLIGEDGDDSITGGTGNDTIDGGNGADTISTGDGDDRVFAGNGEDSILGEAGNDTLNGDGGTDTLDGGNGNDSILGGEADDTLHGGRGADFINGQSGNDLEFGDLVLTTTSVTVFSTNFDSGVPAQLSGTTTVAPVQGYAGLGTGTDVFSGNMLQNSSGGTFANPGSVPQTPTTLTLTNLPSHTSIDINFLLAIINHWTSPSGAPDVFNVRVDGVLVFSSTFDNITPPSTPAYIAPPGGQLTPRPFSDLGFPTTSPAFDSAWDMGFEPQLHNIPHTAKTLTIDLFADGAGFQGGSDASWGIDNLEVILNEVVTAFSTNFDSGVPAQLSGTTTVAPVQGYAGLGMGTDVFSGKMLQNDTGGTFANPGSIPQTPTTLTLTNLPTHTSIDINFLLAIINDWTSPSSAPDVFNVRVDGVLVFSSTFDNITPPSTPAYIAPPGGQLTPRPFSDLGFPTSSPAFDSAWDMGFEPQLHHIPHTANTLTIDFFADGAGFQGGSDASWGIDNLEVILNGVPIFDPVSNDTLQGGNGNDTLIAGAGNDLVNGNLGDDTAIGNSGNDTIFGGAGKDSLLGDGPDQTSTETGNDVIQGQGGDDTLVGGNGVDSLLGGAENDVLRSTFDQALSVTPTPPTPAPPTPPPTGTGLPDAVDSGVGTDSGTVHEMSTGSGDGSLQVSVDATGTFGGSSSVFGTAGSAPFDPIGSIGPKATTFESYVYFRPSTTTGTRQQLSQVAASVSTIRGLLNEANSSFNVGSLNFAVVQTVVPVMDISGIRTGSLLTQTYRITNSGSTDSNFELVRYLDSDQSFDGSFTNSGGGRLLTTAGDEVLFETDAGGTSTNTNFIGITGKGGTLPTSNRFEIDSFNGLRQRIGQGSGLDGQITGDADGDGSIDAGQGYDVSLGLRNTFNLVPGASTVYTTHSFFGTGFPTSVDQINQPPLASDDGPFDTISAVPVTFDVVSNDVDLDGVLVFNTVAIATPPANGTAISLGNGLIRYTSNSTFSGTDSFTYTVRDDRNGVSNAATVTINVAATDTIGDILNGGDGNDLIFGAQGGDTLNGMAGNDQLNGGFGNDLIFGGAGNDRLHGDAGNDTLNGQAGNDTVNGDAGDDKFVWMGASDGNDAVQSSEGADTVEVNGKGAADQFSVGQSGIQLQVSQGAASITVLNSVAQPACIVEVVINSFGGNDQVTVNDVNKVGALIITANGGTGDDLLTANVALLGRVRLALNGEAGNDTLVGSAEADTLRGGDGNDIIGAGAGSDTVDGGAGNDSINGQAGDDSILGGDGSDTLLGDLGNDVLLGQNDSDSLNGGDGADTLSGEVGNDSLNGMDGADSLTGGIGQDTLLGGAGNDTLDGGRNDDVLQGNDGDDKVRGDHGNDTLKADGGHDTINGGDGNDSIDGGEGHDAINAEDGNDTVAGGMGHDILVGGDGNDVLLSGGGSDIVLGGDGDDTINAQSGADTVAGNQGNDVIADPASEINEAFTLSADVVAVLEAL